MPTLIVTAVFEGTPMDDLAPGRPIPAVQVEVGGRGRDILSTATDASGNATIQLPEGGSWTISVTENREAGALLGLLTIDVAGDIAMSAVPVRWHPS